MIDRNHELPITRQAELLGTSAAARCTTCPQPVRPADLALMRRIDELHLEHPFAGSRMLRDLLQAGGLRGRAQARRHADARMGIEALYRKPNTSKPAPGAQGLPVPAARAGDRAAQPGLGDGHHLHPDGARLRLPGGGGRLASRRVLATGCRSRWRPRSASRREEALARYGGPRSSTPTRAASSPARRSPTC
jgi:putative transposase